MYDNAEVFAHNDARDSYAAVWALAKHIQGQPIGFGAFIIDDGGDKCAIHRPALAGDGEWGCRAVAVGNHPSIKSLYMGSGVVVCHAEEGVRVIDREFAKKVARLDDDFVKVALACGSAFRKRYLSGGDVEWTRYGKGYCYLQGILRNARHRVARILGPGPAVGDVSRFMIVVGNWSNVGLCIDPLPDGCFHMRSSDWSPQTSFRSVIQLMRQLPQSARMGGSVLSAFLQGYVGHSHLYLDAGYGQLFQQFEDVEQFLSSVSPQRFSMMRAWMLSHGIVGGDDVLAGLLVATSGLAALDVAGGERMRQKVKLWQVFGDVVCKEFVAAHLLSQGGTAADYSRLTGKGHQCNVSMSAILTSSDLFAVCDATCLAVDSKAWADILEGVIGIVAVTQSAGTLRRCLLHFKLLPAIEIGCVRQIVEIGDMPQLDSGKWRRAAQAYVNHKL